MKLVGALVVVGACGTHAAPPEKGAASASASASASGTGSASGSGSASAAVPAAGSGALVVHVLWPTAPAAARAEGARNPCGAARRPLAAISTLHGVSSAVVVITDLPAAGTAAKEPAALVVRDCRIEPMVVMATKGGQVRIESADRRHERVTFTSVGSASDPRTWQPPVALSMPEQPAIDLAWAGAAVAVPADQAGAIRVATHDAPDDASWIIVPDALTAIASEAGDASFAQVANGTHHVIAWLPARDESAPPLAAGDVTISGKDAELTLTLAPR